MGLTSNEIHVYSTLRIGDDWSIFRLFHHRILRTLIVFFVIFPVNRCSKWGSRFWWRKVSGWWNSFWCNLRVLVAKWFQTVQKLLWSRWTMHLLNTYCYKLSIYVHCISCFSLCSLCSVFQNLVFSMPRLIGERPNVKRALRFRV